MSPVVRRIAAALGANSFGQATIILMQLSALPLFLGKWDATTYGTWLMLTAIPAYLSMTDGGLVLAAANKATMQIAQEDTPGANRTFQSAFAFLVGAALAVSTFAAICIYLIEIPGVIRLDSKNALMILVAGILAAQFNGLAETILRATNRYAQGIMLGNISRLLEFSGWIIGLYYFGTFTGVALIGLAMRLTGLTATIIASISVPTGIAWGLSKASRSECTALLRPGLQFMAFPMANALSIQGVTLIVGHIISPAAVTIFNTYRTLSRVALQVTMVLGNSLWAEFSKFFATNKTSKLKALYQRGTITSILFSAFISIAVFLAAPYVISIWTRGAIQYDPTLLLILLICSVTAGSWNVPRVLLMAVNSHGSLATQAVIGALATVTIAFFATTHFNIYGAAASVLIVELCLAIACTLAATRLLRRLQAAATEKS